MPVIKENKKDQKNVFSSRKINKKIDQLDKKMDSLYSDIYLSRPDNRHNMEAIIDKIDTSFDRLQDSNISVSGMSELLRRIEQKSDGSSASFNQITQGISEIFGNEVLLNSLFQNEEIHRYISAQNYQYDMICKYLPKLEDALSIKKDNVLCSDNFSKNYINPKNAKSNKHDAETFSSNVKRLENKYELDKFFEKTYMNVSKYGEEFIYVVPYKTAFENFLKGKSNKIASLNNYDLNESTIFGSSSDRLLSENYAESEDYKTFKESVKQFGFEDNSGFKGSEVNITFNPTNVLLDKVGERYVFESKKSIQKLTGLKTLFETNNLSKDIANNAKKFDKLSDGSEGLIIPDKLSNNEKIDSDINGAVVERLKRENIVPIYIGKKCLGYYYFNFAEDPNVCGYCGQSHATPGLSSSLNGNKYGELSSAQQEMGIRYIASKISSSIDANFINANKDLKEEIYSILSYNEKFDINRKNNITVTFIPAEDIIHCYFDIDEDTHRGISDLRKSVIPAMLYILLYLTDIIGKITRSTDKRIYYVKQNVETNVARTMMNVIGQIKKGNMGMRQIESMNNILNVVGKYNDYIIPLGQSGDAPIQFEVMNGQEINTPTDIMEKMEDMAISGTEVPLEMVNNMYNQDFAIRYTMSNTRFLKMIYNRQRDTEKFLSKIYTKIYNYEFEESNPFIAIILPPPIYMSMMNNSQLIDNVNQLVEKIMDNEMADESDEVKNEFKKIYTRSFLSTYIDFDTVERYIEVAKVNVEIKKSPATADGASSDNDDMSEYM
nr:MAG TPA: Portal protein [Caudoviricetes sp.]